MPILNEKALKKLVKDVTHKEVEKLEKAVEDLHKHIFDFRQEILMMQSTINAMAKSNGY